MNNGGAGVLVDPGARLVSIRRQPHQRERRRRYRPGRGRRRAERRRSHPERWRHRRRQRPPADPRHDERRGERVRHDRDGFADRAGRRATASSSWSSSPCPVATTARGLAASARAPGRSGSLALPASGQPGTVPFVASEPDERERRQLRDRDGDERLRLGQHVRVLRLHAGRRGHRRRVRGSVDHGQRLARSRLRDGNDHVRLHGGQRRPRPRGGHDVRQRVPRGAEPGFDVGEQRRSVHRRPSSR